MVGVEESTNIGKSKAEELKAAGNQAFGSGDFKKAVEIYEVLSHFFKIKDKTIFRKQFLSVLPNMIKRIGAKFILT